MKTGLLLLLIMAWEVYAQGPAFEVTSVKINKLPPRERHPEFGCSPGGRFVSTGSSLRSTFFWAFNVRPFQVTGLPAWIDAPGAIFDIEARAGGPVEQSQCRLMAQMLLADRFKLVVHRGMQELPAYALVVAKKGPKIHEVNPDAEPRPGGGVRMFGNAVQVPPGLPRLKGWTMAQLADHLTGQPAVDRRAVVDRTGLSGIYEIDLDYAFVPVVGGDKPEIFDAIQEQLGLKLESVKVPFETLVVERFEKPDAN